MSKIHEVFETRTQEVVDIDADIQRLQERRAFLTRVHQTQCKHGNIGETAYVSGSGLPRMRICLDCGMTEERSPCVLKDNYPRSLSREDVYALRQGVHISEEMSRMFLCKERTLEELINNPKV